MRRLQIVAMSFVLLATSSASRTALAQAAPAPAAEAQAAPATPYSKAPTLVRVRFRTPNDSRAAQLYMRQAEGYKFVCAAPCKAELPAGAELRAVLDDHDDEPHEFVLGSQDDVDIEARRGGRGALAGGIVMTAIGGLTAMAGLFLLAVENMDLPNEDSSSLVPAGVACLALGGGLTAWGVFVIATRSYEPSIRQKGFASPVSRETLFASGASDRARSVGPWLLPSPTVATVGVSF